MGGIRELGAGQVTSGDEGAGSSRPPAASKEDAECARASAQRLKAAQNKELGAGHRGPHVEPPARAASCSIWLYSAPHRSGCVSSTQATPAAPPRAARSSIPFTLGHQSSPHLG